MNFCPDHLFPTLFEWESDREKTSRWEEMDIQPSSLGTDDVWTSIVIRSILTDCSQGRYELLEKRDKRCLIAALTRPLHFSLGAYLTSCWGIRFLLLISFFPPICIWKVLQDRCVTFGCIGRFGIVRCCWYWYWYWYWLRGREKWEWMCSNLYTFLSQENWLTSSRM